MSTRTPTFGLALFGVLTLASGLYRYFSRPDGEKGLWFGLVMGAIALVAAMGLAVGRRRTGLWLGGFSVMTVGGWFFYEAFIIKGVTEAELRQLMLFGYAVVLGVILLRVVWNTREQRPA